MSALQHWLPGDASVLWGVNLFIQVTLISVAALLAAWCGRRSPALKWGILSVGLILVLISPGIVWISQQSGMGLASLPFRAEPATMQTDPVIASTADPAQITAGARSGSVTSAPENQVHPALEVNELTVIAATARSSPEVAGTGTAPVIERIESAGASSALAIVRDLLACVVGMWCCGTVLLLIRLVRAWWKLESIRRTARPVSSGLVRRVLREVCADLRIGRRPRVAVSARVGSPIAVGVRRPEVILPEGLLDQLSPEELHSILTHEVAHIARRDLLVVLGQNLAITLFWVHPLVHVLSRQLTLAREEVCDNHVLGTIAAPSYSRTLLRLAELIQVADPQLTSVSLLPANWKLETRIAGILNEGRSRVTRLTNRSRSLVLMLAALLVVVGAHATLTFSDGAVPTPAAEAQPSASTPAVVEDGVSEQPTDPSDELQFQFEGQVVSPDGAPVAGARIFFAVNKARPLATTDAEGRFEFTRTKSRLPNRAQWGVNRLVAVADGYGPAWLKAIIFDVSGNARKDFESRNPNGRFPRVWEKTKRVLKLVEDDVPIQGRIVDLEGQPVAGVAIQPRFIDQIYARYAFDEVTTDANGAFEVRGVGRGRTVRLVAKSDRTAFSVFFARTEQGPTITQPSRPVEEGPEFPLAPRSVRVVYGATLVHAVASSVPVEGTVTDVDSGNPVAGVTIYAYGLENNPEYGRREELNATTDGRGRYRLTGLPIGVNQLLAIGDGSQPYLAAGVRVRTGDQESVQTWDFKLKRGVWLEGRVTDATSGAPVRATIEYAARAENPFLARTPGFEDSLDGHRGQTDGSGRYRLPVLPGPGVVAVNASDRREYPTGILSDKLAAEYAGGSMPLRTSPIVLFPLGYNFLAAIDPAGAAEREELNVQLQSAPALTVKFIDAEGQPLSGVSVSDYTQSGGFTIDTSSVLTGDVYLVRNYLPAQPRRLVAWHPERNVAGQLVIREQPAGELACALQPAATIKGRIVDADGRPRPARFYRSLTNVPTELEAGALTGADDVFTTNVEGEFEFRWLVPGLTYRVGAVHPTAGQYLGLLLDGVKLEPGEVRDLGNVQLQRETP